MRSATWTAMPNNVRKLNNTAVAKSVWYSDEKKLAGLLVSSILGCGLFGATYLNIKSNTKEILKDDRSILSPSDIQHSFTTSVKLRDLVKNKFYIHRNDLENKITSILHKEKPSKKYYVVYGLVSLFSSISVSMVWKGW
jgi:predicted RND superfamily exporter protein